MPPLKGFPALVEGVQHSPPQHNNSLPLRHRPRTLGVGAVGGCLFKGIKRGRPFLEPNPQAEQSLSVQVPVPAKSAGARRKASWREFLLDACDT